MAELIHETVITSCSPQGQVHVAPMGVRYRGAQLLLMPFQPSTTLDNVLATRQAVLNLVTDVRVFAGCVTGRKLWPTMPAAPGAFRLSCALAHELLQLEQVQHDDQRPVLTLARTQRVEHAPFVGFNRAQAAVLEGAVLVSRLHLLPAAKIDAEMRYLQIAIDKTAGPDELEAWGWLQQAVAAQRDQTAVALAAEGAR